MKYQVTNKVGIDKEICRIQDSIYSDITITNYDCYGRIYKNEKNKTNIPEWYLGKKEYTEVLLNDKVNITSFFSVSDEVAVNNLMCETVCSLIVQADLTKCFPTITERADEILVNTFMNAMQNEKPTRIVKGLQALNNFDTSKLKNMQPYFFFRIEFLLRYNYNCLNI